MKLLLAAVLAGYMTAFGFGGEIDEMSRSDGVLASGAAQASHRGVYQVALESGGHFGNPYLDVDFTVTFTRPDKTRVAVEGFFDGDRSFKARAYCDMTGRWTWTSDSNVMGLDGKSGVFQVAPSSQPGKLRKHPRDPHQFAYDNGDWFLHVGDTGYRYVVQTEPKWREYIDQAAQMGATKIRTWFCQSRSGVEILLTKDRRELNLPYWQEVDRRVLYALEHHPRVILKLIVYGEDTAELLRYGRGDRASQRIASYAQARFSSLPNVMWCISNDRETVGDGQKLEGRRVPASVIDRIGRDMAGREPWGTLLTNHQARFTGYNFVDARWSDVITLEHLDAVDGILLQKYRQIGDDPVVNDEDRYELYRPPQHPRYFFRRLMWSSLLSGGHATYGGLKTYEPYDGDQRGVQGYYDAKAAGKLVGGADDFVHIHKFFRDSGLTLVEMVPDPTLAGSDPSRANCIHDKTSYIVYVANPSGDKPESDDASATATAVTIKLPAGDYRAKWFQPTSGNWTEAQPVAGGQQTLPTPGSGDWVLWLTR
ncbi:MAG: DUF4038 domain-containing protein [Planctomycetes bacterium]|nr:DUF4038 domain-containing protein [Planctomycetota bacterium]